jgi:hypothetical protein
VGAATRHALSLLRATAVAPRVSGRRLSCCALSSSRRLVARLRLVASLLALGIEGARSSSAEIAEEVTLLVVPDDRDTRCGGI